MHRAKRAQFRRQHGNGRLMTSLLALDENIARHPHGGKLMRRSIDAWVAAIPTSRPFCICCAATFGADIAPAACLTIIAEADPTACGIAGVCFRCWFESSQSEIDEAVTRCLRHIRPNGVLEKAP
jgi:hypothetical protein